jgi:DNA repair ATPase RecN
MNTKIKKEEVMTNINESQQKEKNIDSLMSEIRTFEILDSDVENIFNSIYLKDCVERLEGDEYHIEQSIRTIKERISDIEHISQIEEVVKNNLYEIDDLYRFIENVCDTEEDEEEPLSKIEELLEVNEQLNDEITEFYENLNS